MNLLNRLVGVVQASTTTGAEGELKADFGFNIPTLGEILTFVIKFFFVAAGLAALLFLLLGAFRWITSGGNKENVDKAREQIQAAIIGIVLIVVVLAIAVTFERFVFNEKICFGITCPLRVPTLLH